MNLLRTLTLSSVLQLPKLLKGLSLPHNLVHTDIRLYLSAHTPSDSFYMQRRLPLWWSMTLSWPLTSQTVSSSSKAHLHLRLMLTGVVTVVVTSTTLPTSSPPPPSPYPPLSITLPTSSPLHHPPHILSSPPLSPTLLISSLSASLPPSPHPPLHHPPHILPSTTLPTSSLTAQQPYYLV